MPEKLIALRVLPMSNTSLNFTSLMRPGS